MKRLISLVLVCLITTVSCSKPHANVVGNTPGGSGQDQSETPDDPEDPSEPDEPAEGNPLDGKTVMFVGNSFIYYGDCLESGGQRGLDNGYFCQLCKSRGAQVKVYDSTYGGHHLNDFTAAGCNNGCSGSMSSGAGSAHANGNDLWTGIPIKDMDYVFFSESGDNNSAFVTDIEALMKRIVDSGNTKVKFVYLCHSYTWIKNHTKIIDALPVIHNGEYKVAIVNWGKLVYDIINKNVTVPGAALSYNKQSFIKNNGDSYHPNPLAGYITAEMCYLMAYYLESGKNCTCKGLDCCYESYARDNCYVPSGNGTRGLDAFIAKHYNAASDTNCKAIFGSKADMEGLQTLMETYVKNEQ